MYRSLNSRTVLLPILVFFAFYMVWLFRAYYDVAYMDEIQVLAGNIKNMYNHDATLSDYYYRSPFLLAISNILVFINCKLFSYNTFAENIITGLILLFIVFYFVRSNIDSFKTLRARSYFSLIVAIVVFCFAKWEMSLWGAGFSHYMVVMIGFVCIATAHKYYLNKPNDHFSNRFFIPFYIVLSLVAILETTAYFLPFLLSILVLLLINYKLFRDKIILKRWRIVLCVTIGLIIFSFLINYGAEVYSASHPYEAYGKVNLSKSMEPFKKVITEPLFVVKFFLIANAANLIDKDSYALSSFAPNSMPFLGILVLLFYGYALYLFIKRKKTEGIFSINLILCTVIFCATVLVGRLGFNDVYYGASSRYSAITFTGVLGLATFFLLLFPEIKHSVSYRKFIYFFPVVSIVICSLIIDRNQWRIAPYRKENLSKMAKNLKENKNLESLLGYNNEIAKNAREVMIQNKLNVFKPQTKMQSYVLNCNSLGEDTTGFYGLENDSYGPFRWTDGEVAVLLPNLYTTKDTVRVKLTGYTPQADTPKVILNDNLQPLFCRHSEGGYEYTFAFQEQKVFFRISIRNEGIIPHDLNKENPDTRKLGLIFRSVTFYE